MASTRKFKKVAKDPKTGIPKKYLAGAKNKSAVAKEIASTRKKYKAGTLTKAEMDRISKQRSRSRKK
jgi:hypothetical protein